MRDDYYDRDTRQAAYENRMADLERYAPVEPEQIATTLRERARLSAEQAKKKHGTPKVEGNCD